MHSAPEHEDDLEHLHLFFGVEHWRGEPVIGQSDRCSELVRVTPGAPPADVVDDVAEALLSIERGESPLLLRGW